LSSPNIRKPSNVNEQLEICKLDIKMQAFATTSIPDILIVQGGSVGGRENATESQEEQNAVETKMVAEMSGISANVHMFSKGGVDPGSIWGRSVALWDDSEGQ
jgi:hypothetical protein